MSRDRWNALLIALNTLDVSRAAVLLLATEVERWGPPGVRASAALAHGLGVPERLLLQAIALRSQAAAIAARETAAAAALGARILTRFDADYPPAIAEGSHPPPVLYVRGQVPAARGVAIVGSRLPTPYGREVAQLFGEGLAAAGVPVISGFARGIDTAAHQGALASDTGTTVAVLGCGLTVDYPSRSRELAARVARRGAVLSELPCDWHPRNWHFPLRNRLIAALAWGTLVVEAAPRSGSMITVRHTLDLGREVWAVPGRLFDEQALGPNGLIREGATLVQHPRQILEALPASARVAARPSASSGPVTPSPVTAPADPEVGVDGALLPAGAPAARTRPDDLLLAALRPGDPAGADALAAQLGWSIDRVLTHLLELELGGRVARLPGPLYLRRARGDDLAA